MLYNYFTYFSDLFNKSKPIAWTISQAPALSREKCYEPWPLHHWRQIVFGIYFLCCLFHLSWYFITYAAPLQLLLCHIYAGPLLHLIGRFSNMSIWRFVVCVYLANCLPCSACLCEGGPPRQQGSATIFYLCFFWQLSLHFWPSTYIKFFFDFMFFFVPVIPFKGLCGTLSTSVGFMFFFVPATELFFLGGVLRWVAASVEVVP